jgi:hypothetical protein
MKLVYKIIFLSALFSTTYARPMIVLSGQASLEQQDLIVSVLQQKLHIPRRLILFDFKNKKCLVNRRALLQMCFAGVRFKISYQKKEVLQKTFKRVIEMSNNTATHHATGASIEK